MTDNNRDRDRAAALPFLKRKWAPWAIGAAVILLLLLLVSRCGNRPDETAVVPPPADVTAPVTAPVTAAPTGVSGLDAYLAGTDPAPRTFTFERVHFDTGSSQIRNEDRPEIAAVADVLKRYPNARVKLYGYADASGAAPANATLAQARANIVRSALTASGVDARRIEALSGGETNPVASNANPSGMAENRRTELVVVQR